MRAPGKFMKPGTVFSIILLLVLITAVFFPTLRNGFTNWDDPAHVTDNPALRMSFTEALKSPFTSYYVYQYLPLTILTFALEYRLSGSNPFLYHMTNLILHILNCLLVLWLVYLLSHDYITAFITALLFALHPLHVEPVAWISSRKDLLYSAFFLGSYISYLYYKNQAKRGCYYLSLFLFLLSLLSKVMALTLPIVMILGDYLSTGRVARDRWKEKIPFFILSLIFTYLLLVPQRSALITDRSYDFLHNGFMASQALVFYLAKLLLPTHLSCLYPYPDTPGNALPLFFLFSPVIILAIAFLVFRSRQYTRKILFGTLFFLLTILPVLQFIPVGFAMAADRYTYIPSIGLFFLVGTCFSRVADTQQGQDRLRRYLLFGFSGIVVLTLGALSWQRCHVWHDSITLWTDALYRYPSIPLGYSNRGEAYLANKAYGQAETDFRRAVALLPTYAEAHTNLCKVYYARGRRQEALAECNTSRALNARIPLTYNLLGNLHFHDHTDYAVEMYLKAVGINPHYGEALTNLCAAYVRTGRYEEAGNACQRALTVDPSNATAYSNLGNLYLALRRPADALWAYEKALSIDPAIAGAHNNLAVIYFFAHRYDIAQFHADKARELGQEIHPDIQKALKKVPKAELPPADPATVTRAGHN